MPGSRSTEELLQLAGALRQGVRIKDRRYLFRTYRRCFVGAEAVAWLLSSGSAASHAEALRLGNALMELGIFHHCLYEHRLEDDYLFYRFTDDDDDPTALGHPSARPDRPRMGFGCKSSPSTAGSDGAPVASQARGALLAHRSPQLSAEVASDVDAAAAGSPPAPSGRTLLPEPRQDRSRQVLAGQLQLLQGRVTRMQQAAESQRSIADILVGEVGGLRAELAEMRGQVEAAGAAARAAAADAASAAQQAAALRVLCLGLCGCVLQQAVVNWLRPGGGAAGGGWGGGAVFLYGGPSCWGVALAAVVTGLGLMLLRTGGGAPRGPGAAAEAVGRKGMVDGAGGGGRVGSGAAACSPCGGEDAAALSTFASACSVPRATAEQPQSPVVASAWAEAGTEARAEAGAEAEAGTEGRSSLESSGTGRRGTPTVGAASVAADGAAAAASARAPSRQSSALSATSHGSGGSGAGSGSGSRRGAEAARLLTPPAHLRLRRRSQPAQDASQPLVQQQQQQVQQQQEATAGPPPPPPPPGCVVPRLSDFDAWPDAPVLLAFHPGFAQLPPAAAAPSAGGAGAAASAEAEAQEPLSLWQPLPPLRAPSTPRSAAAAPPAAAASAPASPRPRPSPNARPQPPRTPGLVPLPLNGAAHGYGSPLARTSGGGGAPGGRGRWHPIPVETELFSGSLLVFMRGLPSTPDHLFVGRKRMSWVAMQGRFKAPLPLESVVTGQEFARPFRRLPAQWFVEKVLLSMARRISPSMRVGPLSCPHMLMPIIAAAQVVNVSKPGCQPPLMECPEDVRLFCPALAASKGRPASADERRRHFSSARGRAGLVYDTEHVWTFHFWQQFVDLASYNLDFGYTYDLVRHLDGQPLHIMAKDEGSGKYLYDILVWHERLLPGATAAAAAAAAAGAAAAAAADGRLGGSGGAALGTEPAAGSAAGAAAVGAAGGDDGSCAGEDDEYGSSDDGVDDRDGP